MNHIVNLQLEKQLLVIPSSINNQRLPVYPDFERGGQIKFEFVISHLWGRQHKLPFAL